MKKVLFVITKSNWGGAQRYVYDLATSLSKNEFEAVVALGGTGSKGAGAGRLKAELEQAGIRTIFVQSFTRNISLGSDLPMGFELFNIFKKERPEVVHLNSSKAAVAGAVAGRLVGVPRIIATVHGWAFNEPRPFWQQALIKLAHWLGAVACHHTICVSLYDMCQAASWPWVSGKVSCIHNGIAPVDFLPRKPATEGEGEHVRILTNGELTANKNLFLAIDAVLEAQGRGVHITYAIMSEGELKGQLTQYIAERNLGQTVTLLGFVPEGARHYQNFDIFFLPSKKEGLPYVLIEAGYAGLPVVASNVGGIPEIVEDGVSGILKKSSDTAGFAVALVELARSKELRAKLGQNLKEKVERDFTLEQMINKTIAIYKS